MDMNKIPRTVPPLYNLGLEDGSGYRPKPSKIPAETIKQLLRLNNLEQCDGCWHNKGVDKFEGAVKCTGGTGHKQCLIGRLGGVCQYREARHA